MDTKKLLHDLDENGFCVIENIFTEEQCLHHISAIWDWFEKLGTGIDRNNPHTWNDNNWIPSDKGIIKFFVGYTQFIWNIKTNENVMNVFKCIWNNDDLLSSFDGINILRPSIYYHEEWKPWFHCDQPLSIETMDTVRKNYIKYIILYSFFEGLGSIGPQIFRRKSLKNVAKYIILSHFFEPCKV